MNIVPPIATQPIIEADGSMTIPFRTWTQLINNLQIIIGTGSPEGVVDAGQGRQYMDDMGLAGTILYVKRDTDIGGDPKQGWILV